MARALPATADPPASPLDAARALAPRLRAAADEIERARRLPPELVRALAASGIFRLCVPHSLGGGETDPATLVAVLETLAAADGSAGWCAMIGANSGVPAAYLRADVARTIYGAADGVAGGVFVPQGRAVTVDGGYRVTGRWAFASGCEHCDWLMGGSVVRDGGTPRLLPGGDADVRLMFFPARDARVIDTWTVSGLRGTGSHDIEVKDLLVPAERSVSLTTDRPVERGTLYAFPVFGLLALGIAAVALGIARAAIDELVRLACAKTPTLHRRTLAERSLVQLQVAEAEALVRAARAFVMEAIAAAAAAVRAEGTIATRERALLRLAATHATTNAARAVDLMYTAGGGTALYATSPLQRCFRDVHAVTQHMMVGAPTAELAGRVLLGLDADTSTL
jgi:alkylation response protein AidB-like acyl-CoA dehydrogenase